MFTAFDAPDVTCFHQLWSSYIRAAVHSNIIHFLEWVVISRVNVGTYTLFLSLTRRKAIANGTCFSFCNQPKAQFYYLRRVTPVYRWLHPFCGWRHLATTRESKTQFGLPVYAPGTIAVNVTWMTRGFNACETHRSMYTHHSIFNRLRAIARYWSEIATFSYPLHLTPPLGCSHWNSGKKFGPQKTRIMGLSGSENSLMTGWAVSTQYSVWQTDGQTSSI